VVSASDAGSTLRFRVTATNSAGSWTADSAATPVITTAASLTGVAAGRPKLRLTIVAAQPGARIKRLVLLLPRGISFAGSGRKPLAGVTVDDGRGKPLAFTATIDRGALTITLKSPSDRVLLVIDGPAIAASRQLVSGARKRVKVLFAIVSQDTNGANRHDRLQLELS
jgi:hypothetical protein